MEDSFSSEGGGRGGMVPAVMRAMGSDGERWGEADEALLARPAAHLLLCGPVLNGTGPRPGGWGTPALDAILMNP